MTQPPSQPYSWNEKHAEAAGLPVATPADAGKVVTVAEDGSYTLSGGDESNDKATKKTAAKASTTK